MLTLPYCAVAIATYLFNEIFLWQVSLPAGLALLPRAPRGARHFRKAGSRTRANHNQFDSIGNRSAELFTTPTSPFKPKT